MTGLCECGCGGTTTQAARTESRRGYVKGQHVKFLKGHDKRKKVRWLEQDCGYKTPCWVWQLSKFLNGYGQAGTHSGSSRVAHRVVYEELVGPIPDGFQIDHLCKNPPCVNPDHLEPVTPRENQMRSTSMSAIHAAKTHCPYGHEYDEPNTYIARNGARVCRACRRDRHNAQKVWRFMQAGKRARGEA